MLKIIIFILGVVVGWVVVWTWGRVEKRRGGRALIRRQAEEKKWDKERILGLMESGNEPLTNEHIRMMIDIPESTATRYLEELEKEGKIRQVGQTGRSVYYEKIK